MLNSLKRKERLIVSGGNECYCDDGEDIFTIDRNLTDIMTTCEELCCKQKKASLYSDGGATFVRCPSDKMPRLVVYTACEPASNNVRSPSQLRTVATILYSPK